MPGATARRACSPTGRRSRPGSLLAAARAFEQAGDVEQAERVCDEALQHDPNAPDVLRVRARLAEARGDLDDAHALWARMATANGAPRRARVLRRLVGGVDPGPRRQAAADRAPGDSPRTGARPRAGGRSAAFGSVRRCGGGPGGGGPRDGRGARGGAPDHAGRCREAARDCAAAAAERAEAANLIPSRRPRWRAGCVTPRAPMTVPRSPCWTRFRERSGGRPLDGAGALERRAGDPRRRQEARGDAA